MWACYSCSYENEQSNVKCFACAVYRTYEWNCSCGAENRTSNVDCSVCGKPKEEETTTNVYSDLEQYPSFVTNYSFYRAISSSQITLIKPPQSFCIPHTCCISCCVDDHQVSGIETIIRRSSIETDHRQELSEIALNSNSHFSNRAIISNESATGVTKTKKSQQYVEIKLEKSKWSIFKQILKRFKK